MRVALPKNGRFLFPNCDRGVLVRSGVWNVRKALIAIRRGEERPWKRTRLGLRSSEGAVSRSGFAVIKSAETAVFGVASGRAIDSAERMPPIAPVEGSAQSDLWPVTKALVSVIVFANRGERIRTFGLLVPNQAL